MTEDLSMEKHRLTKNHIERIIDPRYAATRWSERYTFSRESSFTGGKAKLDFSEARDDPAFAGTNSGIYEISTVQRNSQRYSWKKSNVVNIGESGGDLIDRVKGKFTGNKKDDWNRLAKEFDLQIRIRSNQKKLPGTSPHPHILECTEFADFKLIHGELPKMNSINAKKIKHIPGDPEPLTRAAILIQKWAKENGIQLENEVPQKISSGALKNFSINEHIGSFTVGRWGFRSFFSFFSKGFYFKAGVWEEPIMYDQLIFKKYNPESPEANDSKIYYADNDIKKEMGCNVTEMNGFGKLQHQLGVLSAIAYLDHRLFSSKRNSN